MLESNPDQELSALGPVPEDFRALVTRTLGDRPITVDYADELLAALSDGTTFEVPPAPGPVPFAAAPSQALPSPAIAGPVPASPAPTVPKLAVPAGVEPIPPVFSESTPPPSEVAQVFESRPAPSPIPPPMFDARPAPSSTPAPTVFDDPLDEDDEPGPDAEAQAQAIEAAFDVNESEPPNRAQHLARKLESFQPLPAAATAAVPPRRERGGSRRPDLDHLLDQPLDALDFERSSPAADSIAPTPPPLAGPAGSMPAAASVPPPAPVPAGTGDDFEILVDDEILEIAEDDVEIVDDDK